MYIVKIHEYKYYEGNNLNFNLSWITSKRKPRTTSNRKETIKILIST